LYDNSELNKEESRSPVVRVNNAAKSKRLQPPPKEAAMQSID